MVIIPLNVKNNEELEKALFLNRNVIVVKDRDLFDDVKKNKKKCTTKNRVSKLGIIGSIIMLPVGIFVPEVYIPLAATALAGSLSVGIGAKYSAFRQRKFKKYSILLDEKNQVLILINEKALKLKYGNKEFLIDGYTDSSEKLKVIKPVYAHNEKDLQFFINEERGCIMIEPDYYKKMKIESKSGKVLWRYVSYDCKKTMQRMYIREDKCDLETCRIEGIDMDRFLLDE